MGFRWPPVGAVLARNLVKRWSGLKEKRVKVLSVLLACSMILSVGGSSAKEAAREQHEVDPTFRKVLKGAGVATVAISVSFCKQGTDRKFVVEVINLHNETKAAPFEQTDLTISAATRVKVIQELNAVLDSLVWPLVEQELQREVDKEGCGFMGIVLSADGQARVAGFGLQ